MVKQRGQLGDELDRLAASLAEQAKDATPQRQQWNASNCPVCRGRGTVVKTYDDYGMADPKDVPCWLCRKWAQAEASLAAQAQHWKGIGELLQSGGMDDPAFLTGMVRAEVECRAAQAQEIETLKAERDKLHAQIMNLRCDYVGKQPSPHRAGYREGFKDARHAAAELVAAVLSSADPEAT